MAVPRWLTETAGASERKRRANASERRVMQALGGRRKRRSGGCPWARGSTDTEGADGETTELLIEHKGISKDTKAMRLQREWLEQIVNNARRSMKDPAMVLTFESLAGPVDWVLLPMEVVTRLLGLNLDTATSDR